MSDRDTYQPGPAAGARIDRQGERWTLVLVRILSHPPERVWQALTDPEHLRQWAPFDADGSLGASGAAVRLSTVGTPAPQISETVVRRAEEPHLLEYDWGGNDLRWELEPYGGGTRLTLWHCIDRGFIAMGAAGWHICFDVMDRLLSGRPLGRIVGPAAMQFDGWRRLYAEYTRALGIESPGPHSSTEPTS